MELIRVSWIFSTHNACLNVHRGETNQQSASEAPTYRSPDLPEPRPTGAPTYRSRSDLTVLTILSGILLLAPFPAFKNGQSASVTQDHQQLSAF